MMQGTYYKEWSSVLNREMEFKVYGSPFVEGKRKKNTYRKSTL